MPKPELPELGRLRDLLRSGRVLTCIAWTSLIAAVVYFLAANIVAPASVAVCLIGASHFLLIFIQTAAAAWVISLQSSDMWTRIYRGTRWITLAGEIGTVVAVNSQGSVLTLNFGDSYETKTPLSMLVDAGRSGRIRRDYRANIGNAPTEIVSKSAPPSVILRRDFG